MKLRELHCVYFLSSRVKPSKRMYMLASFHFLYRLCLSILTSLEICITRITEILSFFLSIYLCSVARSIPFSSLETTKKKILELEDREPKEKKRKIKREKKHFNTWKNLWARIEEWKYQLTNALFHRPRHFLSDSEYILQSLLFNF